MNFNINFPTTCYVKVNRVAFKRSWKEDEYEIFLTLSGLVSQVRSHSLVRKGISKGHRFSRVWICRSNHFLELGIKLADQKNFYNCWLNKYFPPNISYLKRESIVLHSGFSHLTCQLHDESKMHAKNLFHNFLQIFGTIRLAYWSFSKNIF